MVGVMRKAGQLGRDGVDRAIRPADSKPRDTMRLPSLRPRGIEGRARCAVWGDCLADRCGVCGAALASGAGWCSSCGERADGAPPVVGAGGGEAAVLFASGGSGSGEAASALASSFSPSPSSPSSPSSPASSVSAGRPVAAARPEAVAASKVAWPSDLSAYRRKLLEVFGYPEFRGGQEAVLRALPERDVVAIMPTGTGKSLCYVLPALEIGRAVVVSPLIALMQDQVEGLQANGVNATFINSHIDREEQNRRYMAFIRGEVPLLFVAPERFQNPRFTVGLKNAGIHLLAIDEAHCISEWGHNFRPDYLQLGAVRERLGFPRTLALTATANPQVRGDIAQRLGIAPQALEVVTSVDRPNLTFAVEAIEGADDRRRWVVEYVRERSGLTGIVYVRTRRGVEEMAEALRNAGVKAEAYHAGLDRGRRAMVQRRFMLGDLPVIVATNAFGMGVDKQDVRYVIHLNMPGRLEAYYQEAGRAGRDGDHAECTLLYARADRRFQQGFIEDAHPDAVGVRATWHRWVSLAAANPNGDGRLPFDIGEENTDGFAMTVAALRDSGLIDPVALRLTSTDVNAPIDLSGIVRHRAHEEARLREMAEYAETTGCRRGLILRYFGEEPGETCEACDNCLGRHEHDEAPAYPGDLYDEIVALREQLARSADRDPYLVFENRTARELSTFRPASMDALRAVWGIGERRAAWFGQELLRLIAEWEEGHPEAAPPASNPAVQQLGLRPPRGAGLVSAVSEEDVRPDDPLYIALRQWRTERAKS
ncbi:MAG: RecQ family ATP-dependent DNA helicase, partial [Dehalococcoidia bacterium]